MIQNLNKPPPTMPRKRYNIGYGSRGKGKLWRVELARSKEQALRMALTGCGVINPVVGYNGSDGTLDWCGLPFRVTVQYGRSNASN